MNKDNAAGAYFGPSDANKMATEVSQGGAVKATSLTGAIFRNKDDKRGQQDALCHFFEAELGHMVLVPNTSSTRYHSHCEAAAELLVHLVLYIAFSEAVQEEKEACPFNNMEANVYNALHDIHTLTEMAILVYYSQSIALPYLEAVHGSEGTNNLDLVHTRVKSHCQAIIDNPDILFTADASYNSGSLDGKIWHRPDAIYAVKRMSPDFPHLRGALVAYFTGALKTWEHFTLEYVPERKIASFSSSQNKSAWMNATNDHNEGKLAKGHVDF